MSGDENDLLVDAIAEICIEQSGPAAATGMEVLDQKLWQIFERLGYTLVSVPERFGGTDGTLEQAAAVIRGAARKGAPIPLAETMWLAAWLLAGSGRPVPPGPMTAASAAGTDVELTRTDRGWQIDGVLPRVPWASAADLIVVLVPRPVGRMVVELDPAWAELRPGQNLAGEPRPDVVCRSLYLPDEAVASAGEDVTAEMFLNRAALARVTAIAGGCEEVLRLVLAQATEREQFGRPLAKFQAVQHLLAQVAAEATAVVVAAQAAVLALERRGPEEATVAISAAKAGASESAGLVAAWGHQVLGALGITVEHSLHRITRRLWAWRDEFGSEREHRLALGRRVLKEDAWDLITASRQAGPARRSLPMREVEYEVTDGVAVITLCASQRRNALTPELAVELVSAVGQADASSDVGAIVLCGGPSFCAGADRGTLDAVKADPADDANYHAIEGIYQAFLRVGSAKVPTIAAVRGAAVGAGLNLALATDLRIVAHDALLRSGFTRIGLHPGGGHFLMLTRAAGREVAAAMGLFDCDVRGTRAAELGIAWRAVDDGEVEKVAIDLARQAAADPMLARKTVGSFRQEAQPGLSWEAAVHVERAPQMWSFRRSASDH